MPHQCTNCDRTFDDGSKEMLSGCPDCGGNKFQFKPDGTDSVDTPAEPPEPPEPSSSSVARTVGRTAATVKDLMSGGSGDQHPTDQETATSSGRRSNAGAGNRGTTPQDQAAPSREDTAQASARSDVISPEELPSETTTDEPHQFQPVSTDETSTPSTDATTAQSTDATTARSTESDPRTDSSDESAVPDETEARSDASVGQPETVDTERPDLKELRDELNDQFESIKVLQPGQYELNLMELYDREEYIVALEEDGRYSIQVPENFHDHD
ncbi:hypothetical protein BRC91_02850 [Halobacteriales archaeon QS_4_62_28]|nr:MAG: hypothetical protein BRC91_02850 [Halobacteriales archaeon QS_4_62_28]